MQSAITLQLRANKASVTTNTMPKQSESLPSLPVRMPGFCLHLARKPDKVYTVVFALTKTGSVF